MKKELKNWKICYSRVAGEFGVTNGSNMCDMQKSTQVLQTQKELPRRSKNLRLQLNN